MYKLILIFGILCHFSLGQDLTTTWVFHIAMIWDALMSLDIICLDVFPVTRPRALR